jgi:lipopolysaccharide transport system permease protein
VKIVKGYARNITRGVITPLGSVYGNWSLFWMLVKRDLIHRTSGTILGKLWPVVQPALQVLGYWFLFDIVFSMRANRGPEYLEYLLTGMLPWLCVAEVLNRATVMFREFSPLYRRNPFPLEILPVLIMTIPALVYGAVYFCLNLILGGFERAILSLLVLPMLMIWLLPLCLLMPVLGLFIKDFAQAVPFLLMITMFLTPILYFPSMLPDTVRSIIWINPFSDLMAVVHGMLQGYDFGMLNVVRPFLIWLLMLGPAWLVFRRSIPHIREVL